jgi:hypothetical protein
MCRHTVHSTSQHIHGSQQRSGNGAIANSGDGAALMLGFPGFGQERRPSSEPGRAVHLHGVHIPEGAGTRLTRP